MNARTISVIVLVRDWQETRITEELGGKTPRMPKRDSGLFLRLLLHSDSRTRIRN